MKRKNRFLYIILNRITAVLIGISLILSFDSCNKLLYSIPPSSVFPIPSDTVNKWVDWNVLFPSSSTQSARDQYIFDLKQSIIQYVMHWNSVNGTSIPVNVQILNCPCDPLLYNVNATLPLGGSGGLVANPPPKPGNGQNGSGEIVNLNNPISRDSIEREIDTSAKISFKSNSIDKSKTLAVMDTGLDTALFKNHFNDMLWTDPTGKITYRNFQFFNNFKNYEYFKDDDRHKHGTAVTALALEALERSESHPEQKPKVMVLKVLDQNSSGTTFSVSCALSYAIQNNATVINASLGYYGDLDSVLNEYILRSQNASAGPIPIIAAAGNLHIPHLTTKLCDNPLPGNELTDNRKFFPGCFSDTYSNVICVTGLKGPEASCFYQNYSSHFVTVGVVTNPASSTLCCRFPVSILKSGYEGSSFATPVISGKMIGYLMESTGNVWQNCLSHISTPTTNAAARQLTYISP